MRRTIPLRPNLTAHTLCEALDSELGSVVVGVSRKPHEAAHARNLHDEATLFPTLSSVILAHDMHSVQCQIRHAPKVCLDHVAGLLLVGLVDDGGLGVA